MWEHMENHNRNWANQWQEWADWCLPHKDNITQIRIAGQEKPVRRLTDTCIEANFNFASGMYSYMFPPSTIWAKFKHPDPNMMGEDDVADYFESVSRIIHETILESNFAQEVQESLLDMGCFGTNNIYAEEDDDDVVRLRSFTVADYRIETNNKGRVDTVARKLKLDARQMEQEFGVDALFKADLGEIIEQLKSGAKNDTKYEVVHLVMPRTDYDPHKIDNENKPWASRYVCLKTKKIIKESGYDYNPYFVGRFAIGNDEVYGRGPMSMIIGTARRTNSIYRSMVVSAENHANPQWLLPDDDSVSFKGSPNRAGAMLYYKATGGANAKPERLQPNGDPNIALEMYQLHDSSIKRAFFNHLFRPLDDHQNMTATETNARVSTDLMALAPFVNRYQDEVVTPLLTYIYYLLQKQGKLPELPQALADDASFEVEYIGKISLATKSFEVMGAFQTLQMFAETAQYIPQAAEAFINVDQEKLFRETWYANGGSMNVLKSSSDVAEEKEALAQQADRQQMMDNLPQMAQAYSQGIKAPEDGSMSQAAGEAMASQMGG
tara:strand:- start:474 stop:2126 length:1653 start_codon:yes stop_codon:yes gene_type:complete